MAGKVDSNGFSKPESLLMNESLSMFQDDKIAEQVGFEDWTPVNLNQWMTNPLTAKVSDVLLK